MLPENRKPGNEGLKRGTEMVPTLLGGDSSITPRIDKRGNIEGYKVTLFKPNGNSLSFDVSKEQGEDLIEARIAMLASQVENDRVVGEETFQALFPSYVAQEYRQILIGMGVPEDEIPQTTGEMIQRATQELVEYRELGREQIASAAQRVADQILEIASEVFAGNKVRYNQLPKEFKDIVNFHLPSLSALAAQHSGINEETIDAQRRVLTLNLMSQEKTRDAFLSYLPAIAGAGADAAATIVGKLLGTTAGVAKESFGTASQATRNKFNELKRKK